MRSKRTEQDARPTLEEIKTWPATVNVATGGAPFGLGRGGAYEAVRNGTFPVRVIKIGQRYRVVTAEIIAVLEASSESAAA